MRTRLVALIAEMRSGGLGTVGVPSSVVADHAVSIVIKGRARANFAIGEGATATTTTVEHTGDPAPTPRWWRGPATFLVGAATVVGTVVGVAVWVDWNPFT